MRRHRKGKILLCVTLTGLLLIPAMAAAVLRPKLAVYAENYVQYQATSKIREESNVPIIFLTAKSEDTDMILGLNIGADDYITKPFNPAEVIARVRSCLRRYTVLGGNTNSSNVLKNGGIEINDDSKTVTVDGNVILLTPVEYDILLLLMKNTGKVFSSSEIYQKIWNEPFMNGENTVAVHIRHLREKVEINPSEPRYIKVVWGRGYKMEKCL